MRTISFTAIIEIRNINPFILVSALRANAIKPGWRKPLPVLVLVRINGKPADAWRINMMPAGDGSFYLYLHGDLRKASGTAVGDRVPESRQGPSRAFRRSRFMAREWKNGS
jgi:hypothetical protein